MRAASSGEVQNSDPVALRTSVAHAPKPIPERVSSDPAAIPASGSTTRAAVP